MLFAGNINFKGYLSILSGNSFFEGILLILFELVYHFEGIYWNTSYSILAVTFYLIFNVNTTGSLFFGRVKMKGFYRFKVNNSLMFFYLKLFCLKGGGTRL